MILRCPTCSPCTTWIITFQMVISVVLCKQLHHLCLHSLLMRLLWVLSIPLVAFLDICRIISLYPQHGVGLAFLVPLLVWHLLHAICLLWVAVYLLLVSVCYMGRTECNCPGPACCTMRCDGLLPAFLGGFFTVPP